MLTLAKKQPKMFYPQDHSGLRLLEVRADVRFAEGKVITQFEYRGRTRGQRPGELWPGCARTHLQTRCERPGSNTSGFPLKRANRRLVDPPRMAQRPVTAVGTGILSFHAALLGQILHPTGEIVHERMASAGAAVRGGRG
ncbi:hypothetical protein GHK69_15030 [Sinorhizobium meliloti]|nr:hypothetical protein [Sinorhizobium meliloti]